jgi:hypothetical protein
LFLPIKVRGRSLSQPRLHHLTYGRVFTRTTMPHSRGLPRRDATNLKFGGLNWPPMTKTVALPSRRQPVSAGADLLRLELHALRQHTRLDVTPQCDKQFARHGDDGDASAASRQGADTLTEPGGQPAFWLVA